MQGFVQRLGAGAQVAELEEGAAEPGGEDRGQGGVEGARIEVGESGQQDRGGLVVAAFEGRAAEFFEGADIRGVAVEGPAERAGGQGLVSEGVLRQGVLAPDRGGARVEAGGLPQVLLGAREVAVETARAA